MNVNVKAEPEFLNGGLTSTKKAVREKAVRFIKESKDFAAAVGADKVTCCPLGDGFEFAFQCDYRKMWTHLVDAFGECGSYREEIPLFIEYKPSETRGKCFVDSAAKTLCLLHDIGLKNMGVTVDFGHSDLRRRAARRGRGPRGRQAPGVSTSTSTTTTGGGTGTTSAARSISWSTSSFCTT